MQDFIKETVEYSEIDSIGIKEITIRLWSNIHNL